MEICDKKWFHNWKHTENLNAHFKRVNNRRLLGGVPEITSTKISVSAIVIPIYTAIGEEIKYFHTHKTFQMHGWKSKNSRWTWRNSFKKVANDANFSQLGW